MEKNLQKDLTYYNLLIAQDLWQAHYQILLIKCGHDNKICETSGFKNKY